MADTIITRQVHDHARLLDVPDRACVAARTSDVASRSASRGRARAMRWAAPHRSSLTLSAAVVSRGPGVPPMWQVEPRHDVRASERRGRCLRAERSSPSTAPTARRTRTSDVASRSASRHPRAGRGGRQRSALSAQRSGPSLRRPGHTSDVASSSASRHLLERGGPTALIADPRTRGERGQPAEATKHRGLSGEQLQCLPDDGLDGRSIVEARRETGDDVAHLGLTEAEGAKAARGGFEYGRVTRDGPSTSRVDPLLDVFATEDLLGVVKIVNSAPQAKIRDLVGSAERPGLDVIELEESASRTPIPASIEIRAMFSIAGEDLALDRPRNVASVRRRLVVRMCPVPVTSMGNGRIASPRARRIASL